MSRPYVAMKVRLFDLLIEGDRSKADLLQALYGRAPYARSSWQHIRNLINEYRQEGREIVYTESPGSNAGRYRLRA